MPTFQQIFDFVTTTHDIGTIQQYFKEHQLHLHEVPKGAPAERTLLQCLLWYANSKQATHDKELLSNVFESILMMTSNPEAIIEENMQVDKTEHNIVDYFIELELWSIVSLLHHSYRKNPNKTANKEKIAGEKLSNLIKAEQENFTEEEKDITTTVRNGVTTDNAPHHVKEVLGIWN